MRGGESEDEILGLAEKIVKAGPHHVGVGGPAQGRALGPSLLEARAAQRATSPPPRLSELLLSLPTRRSRFDRVLGPAAGSERLMDSLAALLKVGLPLERRSPSLGVQRPLRYRMERLREQKRRHPDDPGAVARAQGQTGLGCQEWGPPRPAWAAPHLLGELRAR